MEGRLRQFVQLVDSGGYVAAAKRLHISQPALSVAIAKLERELHADLLVHGVRPLTLTPAGRMAYGAGKDVLLTIRNLRMQLAELSGENLEVSVGMIDSVANIILASPETVSELEHQTAVSLVVDNSRNLLRSVLDQSLDLAFVVGQPQFPAGLTSVHVGTELLVLVCHPTQANRYSRALKGGMLPAFISYDQASTTHNLITSVFEQYNVVSYTTLYSTSPDVMLRLVLLQKGAAVLPYSLVRKALAAGMLSVLGVNRPLIIERHIYAIQRRGATLPKVLQQNVEHLSNLLATAQLEAERI